MAELRVSETVVDNTGIGARKNETGPIASIGISLI